MMKYNKKHSHYFSSDDLTALETLITEARKRFSKDTIGYEQEVNFDDDTTLPFKDGQLLVLTEEQATRGIVPLIIKFIIIKIYKGKQERSRYISLDASVRYNVAELIVASSGTQADIDWGKATYEGLSRIMDKTLHTELQSKASNDKQNVSPKLEAQLSGPRPKIDWKWLVGILVGVAGVVLSYLELSK